jgi:hypothetical protein
MRSSRTSWTIQKAPKVDLDFSVDVHADVEARSVVSPPPMSRRRRHGFAFGIGALFAAATATLVGMLALEIFERRAFDYTSRPLALESLGRVSVPAPFPSGSDGMTLSIATTSASPSNAWAASERRPRTGAPAIAMIGDSWISGSKLDEPFRQALAEVGLADSQVLGIGEGGATSRRILQNLVSESESNAYSSRSVLEGGEFDFCLVIAGVNDSATHLGADFYAHHVTEIARLLLARGITPLILELPEYGIETVREEREGVSLVKDWLLSALFDQGEVDVVDKYRRALAESLEQAGVMGRVELIQFEPVASDYDESIDLYADPVHLNDRGRERLTGHLATVVLERHERLDRDGAPIRFAGR